MDVNKCEKFYETLRNAGITEYWATPEFKPEDGRFMGSILIPTDNSDLYIEISAVLNGDLDEETHGTFIYCGSEGSKMFSVVSGSIKGLERRTI